MSITAWTHPRVTPADVGQQPYFDGRAECWVWGTWARAWHGIESRSAWSLLKQCQMGGLDVYRYGADLPAMAHAERRQNLWAVRWLYWHLARGGLCLRPPQSLVEEIGSDARATNAVEPVWFDATPRSEIGIPNAWPAPVEHPECASLWQQVYGRKPEWWQRVAQRLRWAAQHWAIS